MDGGVSASNHLGRGRENGGTKRRVAGEQKRGEVARALYAIVLLNNVLHFLPRLGLSPSQGLLKVALL